MVGRTCRLVGLVLVLGALAAPAAVSAEPRDALSTSTSLQAGLLEQVNALRVQHGLSRLRLSVSLTAAATGHSVQMARLGYFSHNSANGGSFSQRIARFYPARGYYRWTVGENLLWGSPDVGAARALKLWLASPPHRANLLSPDWREIGLSAVHAPHAAGVYGGGPATIVTADFGARTR
jgi:uncharacterized protein YkwD